MLFFFALKNCLDMKDEDNPEITTDINAPDKSENIEMIQPRILDIKDGMERLGSSMDFYLKLASFFLRHFNGVAKDLKDLMDKGAYKDARLLAHSLNGASANISAINVRRLAMSMEEALDKNENELAFSILENLGLALDDVFLAIQKLEIDGREPFELHETEEYQTIDEFDFDDIMLSFDRSLQDFDPVNSEKSFQRLRVIFGKKCDPEPEITRLLIDIKVCIDEYRFDDARKILASIAKLA